MLSNIWPSFELADLPFLSHLLSGFRLFIEQVLGRITVESFSSISNVVQNRLYVGND